MSTAKRNRHRPLLPATARVVWDPSIGWPFPHHVPAVAVQRAKVRRALALVRARKQARADAAVIGALADTTDWIPGRPVPKLERP